MQRDSRSSGGIRQDLDVAPMDAPDARTQGFGNGFLGGETPRELRRPPSAVRVLAGGVHATEESLAEALQRLPDAPNLDDIDPYRPLTLYA